MIYLYDTGRRNGKRMAMFRCPYCGKMVERWYYNGIRQKSCGCKKYRFTHRETKTRLYRIWANMKQRCYNANIPDYKHYGAKGIGVCDAWRDSFEVFRDWAKNNGYKDNLTIDRIDPLGDYAPENCRWITRSQNTARASSGRSRSWAKLTPNDVRWIRQMNGVIPQREMARRLGVSYCIIWKVVHKRTYLWVS